MPTERNWLLSNRANWYPQPSVTDYAVGHRCASRCRSSFGVAASGVRPASEPSVVAGAAGTAASSTALPTSHPGALPRCGGQQDGAGGSRDGGPRHRRPAAAAAAAIDHPGAAAGAATAAVGGRNTVDAGDDGQPAAGESRPRRAGDHRRDPALLRLAHRRCAVSGLFGGDARERPARRPQPGLLRRAQQPAADHAVRVAQRPGDVQRLPRVHPRARGRAPVVGPGRRLEELPRAVDQRGVRAVLRRALRPRAPRRRRLPLGQLRNLRSWSMEHSDQGPISLGYRLGPRQERAAGVPRAWSTTRARRCCTCCGGSIGDEAFFNGLRRFYAANRYRKAGTDDLRQAMEAESGRDLVRFFDRWVLDTALPRVRITTATKAETLEWPTNSWARPSTCR